MPLAVPVIMRPREAEERAPIGYHPPSWPTLLLSGRRSRTTASSMRLARAGWAAIYRAIDTRLIARWHSRCCGPKSWPTRSGGAASSSKPSQHPPSRTRTLSRSTRLIRRPRLKVRSTSSPWSSCPAGRWPRAWRWREACPSKMRCASAARSPTPWRLRTRLASCIVISNRPTSCSPPAEAQRSWTSAWPNCRRPLMQATALTLDATQAGTVVGTISYMAPEQAEGRPIDGRADLFAFGATFYEMLTGVGPFELNAGRHARRRAQGRLPPDPRDSPRDLQRHRRHRVALSGR